MLRWTLQSLVAEPLALAAGIAAAGSALLLVIFYEAVWAGESERIVAYPQNVGADVWVMQRGVENMHMATSYLQDWKVAEVRAVSGVAEVEPILYFNTTVTAGGRQWVAYVVGLETPAKRTGPWAMAAGKREPAPGEAIVPAVFADLTDLGLGDAVRIVDRELTIVGLSEGTFSMANSVIFLTRFDVEEILSALDIVSFMVVAADPGVAPETLASDIELAVENVEALPGALFLNNDRQLTMQMGVETIALMTLICGALAVLIVAFTVHSHVVRQRRELAVVKALGATNRALYLSMCTHAGILALASVVFAGSLAWLAIPLVTGFVPMVAVELTPAALVRVAVAGVLVGIVAAMVSARRIARIDPLTVFQS